MSSPPLPPSMAASAEQAPLLRSHLPSNFGRSTSPIGPFAALLGRATGRRGTSMVVREMAARELEERRVDWGYSKPVVALDIGWNLAFVFVTLGVLIHSADEKPNTPIRLWVLVYAAQCLVHAVLVWLEFRRRMRMASDIETQRLSQSDSDGYVANESDGSAWNLSGVAIRCESVNTLVSLIWWLFGFYWVVGGGNDLVQNAPSLYWLAVVFLAFDVFFAIFCVFVACSIGIALCCCLPCFIALAYAVAGQEGATDADLSMLPQYRYQMSNEPSPGDGLMVPVETSSRYLTTERVLLHEDAECCICLSPYKDGVELHVLPCNHHFHNLCITKWLKLNATCPLCKYDILKNSELV